ncbi:DUF922 domain-containing protein [Fluoribacter dumoffii]|uniref:DUF922 domain-containing protein n=1 Tax=Fluoribacter dumoffii TaxID=463 RepID=UPI00026C7DF7|nr:DUF922 domain-containing protein [Fluoribacter dumoffii]
MIKKITFILIHLFAFNLKIHAVPTVNNLQTFYKITGVTEQELRQQLNDLGPISMGRHYDAKTSWYINWNYKWRTDNEREKGCYLTEVNVTADIVTLLPAWENKNYGSSEPRLKWENYLANLIRHEEGHGNNGREAAAELEEALLKIPPMLSCELLQSAIQNTAQNIINQHNNWDVTYDLTTQHGKTQGAYFPGTE